MGNLLPQRARALTHHPRFMTTWFKAALALVAVWLVAGLGIWWLHATKPTPQSVTAFLDASGLDGKSGRDRERTIRRAEDQLNDLTPQDRQELQKNGSTRRFFGALTKDEQSAFLDATLPADFKQMMDVFNKMDPAKRKEFVARAVEEIKKHAGEDPPPGVDDALRGKIVDQGLKSFYADANADTKIDLAPLIEQMQRNLQFGNGN